MNGKETLDLQTLDIAYQERLKMMHDYIRPAIITKQSTTVRQKKTMKNHVSKAEKPVSREQANIYELIMKVRNTEEDIAELLRNYIYVAEVTV